MYLDESEPKDKTSKTGPIWNQQKHIMGQIVLLSFGKYLELLDDWCDSWDHCQFFYQLGSLPVFLLAGQNEGDTIHKLNC